MRQDSAPTPHLLVACLCAAWCRTCDDYRPTFDMLAPEFSAQARFVWVDIEDDEDALGDVDVQDFPTLLVAHGDAVLFFGPVLPHAANARALLQRAAAGELPAVLDPELKGLPARIAKLP